MIGNNNRAIGVHRVNVLLYDPQNLNPVTATGRYYLPDNTFLQNKYIVGVQALVYAAGAVIAYPMPQSSPSEAVLGQSCRYAQISELLSCYLTLYNQQNRLVIENFPILQLDNNQYFIPAATNVENKIIPITGYFNFRQSFVYTPAAAVGANTQLALAFYYQ